MMWVNETLPPRVRPRCELMTMRLSISNLAGIARTLVAVGMLNEESMLAAKVLAMPFSTVTWSSALSFSPTTSMVPVTGACAGIGCGFGSILVVLATGAAEAAGAATGATGETTGAAAGAAWPLRAALKRSRIGHHSLSTESGFASHCSCISSTSH